MKLNRFFLIVVFPLNLTFGQNPQAPQSESHKKIKIEIFASGRFTAHAGYENGIYEYEFSKTNIYNQRIYTHYSTKELYDSAYQYFYKGILISKDSCTNLTDTSFFKISDKPFYYPDRLILLIYSNPGFIDTLIINDYRLVKYKNKVYMMSDNILSLLLNNLPLSLKDNWSLPIWQAEEIKPKAETYKR